MTIHHVRRTRLVPAPREAVWDALAAFDRIVDWAPQVTHSAATTEAVEGVGAARRVQVGRQVLIETVTTWDPPATLAYRIDGLPPIVAGATNRWNLATARGGTLVSLTSLIDDGGTRRGRAASRVVGRVMAKASDGMLDGIAAYLADTPSSVTPTEDAP